MPLDYVIAKTVIRLIPQRNVDPSLVRTSASAEFVGNPFVVAGTGVACYVQKFRRQRILRLKGKMYCWARTLVELGDRGAESSPQTFWSITSKREAVRERRTTVLLQSFGRFLCMRRQVSDAALSAGENATSSQCSFATGNRVEDPDSIRVRSCFLNSSKHESSPLQHKVHPCLFF